jgi:hypothetical protein
MRTEHQLVGYDPVSEQPTFSLPISNAELQRINFHFDEDDPEGVFTYRLEYSKASDLARHERPPKDLEYFIEPYP